LPKGGDGVSYTVHYGVLRTGQITSTLPVASCTAGDEMRGTGSFAATVMAGQGGEGALWQATRGGATFWALEWAADGNRRIVAAGPMWARTGDDNGIQYGGAGLFSVLGHRKLLDQTWTDAQITAGALTFSNLDLGSIMAAIVARVTTTAPADIPITFEAPRTDINTRTYQGYDLSYADAMIVELGNVAAGTQGNGGPDWALTPQFKGNWTMAPDFTRIEWAMTTGTTASPNLTQTGPALVIDRSAPQQQNVGAVSVVEDASALATTFFNSGAGTQASKVIGSATDATLTNLGYPRLDADDTSNSTDYATVQAYAAGGLVRRNRTPSGTTVLVRASWWWAQGLNVGASVRLIDPDHAVFGAIDLTSRVLKWTADVTSEWVQLTLADSLTQV
jgi:hypothetical protein